MSNVRFFSSEFFRPDGTSRRVTAAIHETCPVEGESDMQIGFSICNPVDQFDRKLGQRIAQGRLDSGHSVRIVSRRKGDTFDRDITFFREGKRFDYSLTTPSLYEALEATINLALVETSHFADRKEDLLSQYQVTA